MRKRIIWILLMLLSASPSRAENTSDFSSCHEELSDDNKVIAKATREKVVVSKNPVLPTSLKVASLLKDKEPPVNLGCVALKFRITKDGKAEGIEVLESVPDKVFVESAIRALKGFEFSKKPSMGIQIFNYRIDW